MADKFQDLLQVRIQEEYQKNVKNLIAASQQLAAGNQIRTQDNIAGLGGYIRALEHVQDWIADANQDVATLNQTKTEETNED